MPCKVTLHAMRSILQLKRLPTGGREYGPEVGHPHRACAHSLRSAERSCLRPARRRNFRGGRGSCYHCQGLGLPGRGSDCASGMTGFSFTTRMAGFTYLRFLFSFIIQSSFTLQDTYVRSSHRCPWQRACLPACGRRGRTRPRPRAQSLPACRRYPSRRHPR